MAILGIAVPVIGASFTVAYKWPQFYEQASRATMKVAVCISFLAAAYYVGAQHALIEAKRLISENQSLPENVADFRSQYHWFLSCFLCQLSFLAS
ncbi:hypothetical protein HED54_14725 [Ochrobactrum anthropi ATCC 49188]|nr:hypothetical protein [Brucella anthropi ATCC 49188]NKC48977.1 hypothetical protein [Brucella anthropi ATCC 49188]